MTDDRPRTCTEPGCARPRYSQDLCQGHWHRAKVGSTLAGPIGADATAGVVMACPDSLLELADACVDNDARAIVRLIWPHLLEASFAGLQPFTLEAAS